MKFLKKTIIGLILTLFLCFTIRIKEPMVANAASTNKYIYGTITFKDNLTFDDEFQTYFDNDKITFKYNNRIISIGGIRVRITSGSDYILEYYCNLNNLFEWTVFYSESRGEWENNDSKTIYINGFVQVDNYLISFCNSNLGLFIGYPINSGDYYFDNSYNNLDNNVSKTMSLGFYNSNNTRQNYGITFYDNIGRTNVINVSALQFNSQGRISIGTSDTSLRYEQSNKHWQQLQGTNTIQYSLPNLKLTLATDVFVRPSSLVDVFINDPTFWLLNNGFVKRYKFTLIIPQGYNVLPYIPSFINGNNLTLQFIGEQPIRVEQIDGQANYTFYDNTIRLVNIKSDILVRMAIEHISTPISIWINEKLSQEGILSFIDNTINITLNYGDRNNLTLNIINKDTGIISNVGSTEDVLQLINTNNVSGVIYDYFGYNFQRISITKYLGSENLGSKLYSTDKETDRYFNALNEFGNDDGFFDVIDGTRYDINIFTQGGTPPDDSEKVKNTMENIFDTFKTLINLKIGWWSIGSILSIVISLSILLFIVKLWKGGK